MSDDLFLRNKLLGLANESERTATACSQRGDWEGSFYARGLRDAYRTAALILESAAIDDHHADEPVAPRWRDRERKVE